MRKYVSELLRQMGIHQIHEAADGKGALAEAIKFQPNLVLSDIHKHGHFERGATPGHQGLPNQASNA